MMISACGGGGGGESSGGGGSTSEDSGSVGVMPTPSGEEKNPLESATLDVVQDLSSLSFEELKSYFPSGQESISSISKEEVNDFFNRYLQAKGKSLTWAQKLHLKKRIFGNNTWADEKLSQALQDKLLDVDSLDETKFEDGDYINSLLDSWTDAERQELKNINPDTIVPKKGILDKNGDGEINFKDFVFTFQSKDYYYWNYFLDASSDTFKANFSPPSIGILKNYAKNSKKQVIILDFKEKLGLKKIDRTEAKTILDASAYKVLPDSVSWNNFNGDIFKFVAIDAQTQADKVIKSIILMGKKIIFLMPEQSLTQDALILSPSLWVFLKASSQQSFLKLFETNAWAGEMEDAAGFLMTPGSAAWNVLRDLLDKIGFSDDETGEITPSSDWDSANFIPPRSAATAVDLIEEQVKFNAEINAIQDKTYKILQLSECDDCDLKKLMGMMSDLHERIRDISNYFYARLIPELKQNIKDLEEDLGEVYDIKEKEDRVYDQQMKIAFGVECIRFITGVIGNTVKETIKKINDQWAYAAATEGVLVAVDIALQSLINSLETTESLLVKAGLQNFVRKIKKIKEFTKGFKGLMKSGVILDREGKEISKRELFSKGVDILMSFGLSLAKAYAKGSHEERSTLIDNGATALSTARDDQSRFLYQSELFYDFLLEKMEHLETIQLSIARVILYNEKDRRSEQDQCRDIYAETLRRLESEHQEALLNLEKSLQTYEEEVKNAEKEFKKYEEACEEQKFKIKLASDSMKTSCMEVFEKVSCDKAIQKHENSLRVYLEDLKCIQEDAPQRVELKRVMDNLTVQKESAKAEKQTLKNELLRQISQAETTKNSCLNAIPGGCKQSLPALTMTAGQELANRSTNINESLTSLKDKLTQVKNSCTGTAPTAQGTTTISACENLAKKKVYLTFDQPRKYLGYDGTKSKWAYNWEIIAESSCYANRANSYESDNGMEGGTSVKVVSTGANAFEIGRRVHGSTMDTLDKIYYRSCGDRIMCPEGDRVLEVAVDEKFVSSYYDCTLNPPSIASNKFPPYIAIGIDEEYSEEYTVTVHITKNVKIGSNPDRFESTEETRMIKSQAGVCSKDEIARLKIQYANEGP